MGTVEHEFLHALGVHHEQNRPDRDQYVDILWDNMNPKWKSQFSRRDSSEVLGYGPYDYGSVMHYGAGAFATSNGLRTIKGKVNSKHSVLHL